MRDEEVDFAVREFEHVLLNLRVLELEELVGEEEGLVALALLSEVLVAEIRINFESTRRGVFSWVPCA